MPQPVSIIGNVVKGLVVSGLLLTGCVSVQERQQGWQNQAEYRCEQAGYARGTQPFAQCSMTLYQQAADADAARRAALFAAGVQMMTPPPAPAPNRPVTCVPVMRNGSYYCQ